MAARVAVTQLQRSALEERLVPSGLHAVGPTLRGGVGKLVGEPQGHGGAGLEIADVRTVEGAPRRPVQAGRGAHIEAAPPAAEAPRGHEVQPARDGAPLAAALAQLTVDQDGREPILRRIGKGGVQRVARAGEGIRVGIELRRTAQRARGRRAMAERGLDRQRGQRVGMPLGAQAGIPVDGPAAAAVPSVREGARAARGEGARRTRDVSAARLTARACVA